MDKKEILKVVNNAPKKFWSSFVTELGEMSFNLEDIKCFDFKLKDIRTDDDIDAFVKKIKVKKENKYVYIFSTNDIEATCDKFKKYRDENKDKLCIAKDNDGIENPNVVYVGSSADLSKRIKEHMGKIGKATYSIRFKDWLSDDLEINCCYFEVDTEKQTILQMLEDGIWESLRPMAGKRGGR